MLIGALLAKMNAKFIFLFVLEPKNSIKNAKCQFSTMKFNLGILTISDSYEILGGSST